MKPPSPQHMPPGVGSMATGSDKWLGHFAMLIFAVLIAGSFSIGHLAAPHIAPAALNAIRFVLACLVMGTTILALSGRAPKLPPSLWRIAILGALMATYFILMFTALQITGPVSTAAVFYPDTLHERDIRLVVPAPGDTIVCIRLSTDCGCGFGVDDFFMAVSAPLQRLISGVVN